MRGWWLELKREIHNEGENASQEKKVVILDGTHPGEKDLAPVFSILLERIKASGAETQVFSLREFKLA
jgi:hypothetical protein